MSAGRKAKNLASWEVSESWANGERHSAICWHNATAFEALLGDLAKIVSRSGKELDDKGLRSLRDGVEGAVTWYGTSQFAADEASKITLREITKPLARVLETLKREGNRHAVISALGGEHGSFYCDIELGVERRKALIADLERIAAMPQPERRRGARGNRDLHHLVHRLANEWLVLTDTRFTQDWHDKIPVTGGAEFVHAVVKFIDPENLTAVPKMTERVVKERNRDIVMPWLARSNTTSVK